jgi:hypothetical protein
MNNHRIIATEWQLQAAQKKRLGAVIVPLKPQPILSDTADCFISRGVEWRWTTSKVHATWAQNDTVPDLVLKYCGYAEGDRLYLAEEWWDNRITGEPDEVFEYFLKSVDKHLTHCWETAATMPPEAAQYWYEVTGVQVKPMDDLSLHEIRMSSLFEPLTDDMGRVTQTTQWRWTAAYPDQPWDDSRWVILLQVKDATINPE